MPNVYGLAKCSRPKGGGRVDLPACVDLPEGATTEAFVLATEQFAADRGLYLIAWFTWSEARWREETRQRAAQDHRHE